MTIVLVDPFHTDMLFVRYDYDIDGGICNRTTWTDKLADAQQFDSYEEAKLFWDSLPPAISRYLHIRMIASGIKPPPP